MKVMRKILNGKKMHKKKQKYVSTTHKKKLGNTNKLGSDFKQIYSNITPKHLTVTTGKRDGVLRKADNIRRNTRRDDWLHGQVGNCLKWIVYQ